MTYKGFKRRVAFALVNKLFAGPKYFEKKNKILKWGGVVIGRGSKIVAPLHITTDLIIGDNSWVGAEFSCWGNGNVKIGCDCNIAPQVTVLTGTHEIGTVNSRAGRGMTADVEIGDGTWVCARSTILPGVTIGRGCVLAAGSVITSNTKEDELVGGVPARVIRGLADASD